ncbi:MAG: hypothetical protein J6C88_01040 [Lachnospiraceae bacterium]|nr:hypothetical protein [Lachnospiraceae bacterium]
MEENNILEVEEKTEKAPRNAVVAAKERLYDRVNLTVGQVDKFIIICVAAIILLTVGGVMLS